MSDTLGSMRAEILLEMRGDLSGAGDIPLINSKINNAIENLWMAMMRVALARFFGSDQPVSFTLASGAEFVLLTSITDPATPLVGVAVAGGALGGRTYKLSYTLVTESGSETNPSPVQNLVVGANNL